MKFHKQTLHSEKKQAGDCFRTALACLLDLHPEQVPHFMADFSQPEQGVWRAVDAWLMERYGLRRVSIPYKTDDVDLIMTTLEQINPGLRYKLAGKSPRGVQHTVIVEGGKVLWDPHPEGGGIVGPGEDGLLWVDFLLPVKIHGERAG